MFRSSPLRPTPAARLIATRLAFFSQTILALLVLAAWRPIALPAQQPPPDAVTLRSVGDDRASRTLNGRVIDFSGDGLVWETLGGTQTTLPAERVLEIESTWLPAHGQARQLFAARRYEEALARYGEAVQAEPRRWVRRLILAQAVWCCRNLGQQERALRTFAALVASDPTTPYLECIPLNWTSPPTDPALVATAQRLMATDAPAAACLAGASWLLGTAQDREATAQLRQLAEAELATVSQLAAAQLWRPQAIEATPAEVARWGAALEQLPEPLRAGPLLVWGDALGRSSEPGRAAQVYLQIPLLHSRAGDLAAEAWYRGGRALEQAGRREEAALAYEALLQEFPNDLLAPTAKARLEQLRR